MGFIHSKSTIKRFFLLISLILVPLITIARDFVIVIDAGHGGHDCGAVGKRALEKDITLNVANNLGTKIESAFNNVKVVYTRKTDKYLTLQQRANIANKANGDLFISIHVNSVDLKTAGREKIAGASVFTLGLHRTDDNLAVAKRENAVIELEKDYTTTYSGFNPNSAESYIIFEMNQNKHMLQSINFASSVQEELINTAGRKNKGVRQAGFWVLWATSMPSVLIELDFICNPTQESFLSSKDGQEQLATSIYNAFHKYYTSYSKQISDELTSENDPNNTAPTSYDSNEEQDHKLIATTNPESKTIYRIQILTSNKKLKKGDREFKGLTPIWSYFESGSYKYTYEESLSLDEIKEKLQKIKAKFPQAFIVKFINNKRIK